MAAWFVCVWLPAYCEHGFHAWPLPCSDVDGVISCSGVRLCVAHTTLHSLSLSVWFVLHIPIEHCSRGAQYRVIAVFVICTVCGCLNSDSSIFPCILGWALCQKKIYMFFPVFPGGYWMGIRWRPAPNGGKWEARNQLPSSHTTSLAPAAQLSKYLITFRSTKALPLSCERSIMSSLTLAKPVKTN